jgi:hypothetical protein
MFPYVAACAVAISAAVYRYARCTELICNCCRAPKYGLTYSQTTLPSRVTARSAPRPSCRAPERCGQAPS